MNLKITNGSSSARSGAFTAGLIGLLAACSGSSEPMLVSLEASSSLGDDIEVTYVTGDGEVTEVVTSPWSLDIERSGSFSANLVVRNTGLDGSVRCAVSSGAFPPIDTGGEAAAMCRAQVSQRGDSTSVSSSTDFELFLRNASGEAVALPDDMPEPQVAEVGSVTQLDGRVLLGGHRAVYLLDTTTGVVETVPGSADFGNPLEVAMAEDGTIYAVNIFKDLVQAIRPGSTEVVDIAEFPDESPNGVWVVDGQLLVLLSGPDALLALDDNGAELWRYEFGDDVSKAHVAPIDDGTIAVGSGALPLVGIDIANGDEMFEVSVRNPVIDLHRREDVVMISFDEGDDGLTIALPLESFDQPDPSGDLIAGRRVVFDAAGVPYAAGAKEISRLTSDRFEVDSSIEPADRQLLAAGDDVLFVYEKERAGSDTVLITALPTTLFD